MLILVKFPTRSRPEKALNLVRTYVQMAADPSRINFLITVDRDDKTMGPDVQKQLEGLYPGHVQIDVGYSANKIHACNRGMNTYGHKWDIVLLASDDMICQVSGWDKIIREAMADKFPDTDGALWFWDGDPATMRGQLCTMNIMGRKYYNRFGYLYHPSYLSLWSDNEYTEVARMLNRLAFYETVLFRHIHFSNTLGLQPDALMRQTQKYFQLDERNYKLRKLRNFDLKPIAAYEKAS